MNNTKSIKPTPRLPEVNMEVSPTVELSAELYQTIRYLCFVTPQNKEWSGIICYTIDGNPEKDMGECTFKVQDFFLMDLGTSGYTEYEMATPEFVKFLTANDKYRMKTYQLGHLHSHHTMDSFFSGTDMGELHDNAPNHYLYLSIIVNNQDKIIAKVCRVVEKEIEFKQKEIIKTRNNKLQAVYKRGISTEKVLEVFDCSIVRRLSVLDGVTEQLSSLLEKEKKIKSLQERAEKYQSYNDFSQLSLDMYPQESAYKESLIKDRNKAMVRVFNILLIAFRDISAPNLPLKKKLDEDFSFNIIMEYIRGIDGSHNASLPQVATKVATYDLLTIVDELLSFVEEGRAIVSTTLFTLSMEKVDTTLPYACKYSTYKLALLANAIYENYMRVNSVRINEEQIFNLELKTLLGIASILSPEITLDSLKVLEQVGDEFLGEEWSSLEVGAEYVEEIYQDYKNLTEYGSH